MRLRLSYANVVATLALVFSMSGGAFAAQHYLITKVSQISPSVRAQLRGDTGRAGPRGLQGTGGPAGPQGPAGVTDGPESLCNAIVEAWGLASERAEPGLEEALATVYVNGCE
jgi:hypothetical protein